jgi:hypothetical protein
VKEASEHAVTPEAVDGKRLAIAGIGSLLAAPLPEQIWRLGARALHLDSTVVTASLHRHEAFIASFLVSLEELAALIPRWK